MPRIIDKSKDLKIMNYLREHNYRQTAEQFGITETQVSRIKKRSENGETSIPKPESNIQVQDPTPAAHEEKAPELPKPTIKKEPKEAKAKMNDIPEFDDLIKFCFEHIQDADCQTFLAHNLPPRQERSLTDEQRLKLGITEIRKGGGHSGATKIALTILRKMRNIYFGDLITVEPWGPALQKA